MTEEEQIELQASDAPATEDKPIINKESPLVEKMLYGTLTAEDIPDHIYKSYLRSILGCTKFSMAFSLFDNAVQIEYSEVSVENCDKYNKLVAKYSYSTYLLQKLAALVYINKIQIQDRTPYAYPFNIPDTWMSETISESEITKEIEAAYANAFGFLNESIHRLLPLFWSGFNQILKQLVTKGIPTSF